jgi:hypothetical protein
MVESEQAGLICDSLTSWNPKKLSFMKHVGNLILDQNTRESHRLDMLSIRPRCRRYKRKYSAKIYHTAGNFVSFDRLDDVETDHDSEYERIKPYVSPKEEEFELQVTKRLYAVRFYDELKELERSGTV